MTEVVLSSLASKAIESLDEKEKQNVKQLIEKISLEEISEIINFSHVSKLAKAGNYYALRAPSNIRILFQVEANEKVIVFDITRPYYSRAGKIFFTLLSTSVAIFASFIYFGTVGSKYMLNIVATNTHIPPTSTFTPLPPTSYLAITIANAPCLDWSDRVLTEIEPSKPVAVLGKNQEGSWYLVRFSQSTCWIKSDLLTPSNFNLEDLFVISEPFPPLTLTPTPTITGTLPLTITVIPATYTPYPTYTPYSTYTPYPTTTPQPTATMTPTPIISDQVMSISGWMVGTVTSCLTSIIAFVGFISTTLITWKKEAREGENTKIDYQRTLLELEKARIELSRMNKQKESRRKKLPSKSA